MNRRQAIGTIAAIPAALAAAGSPDASPPTEGDDGWRISARCPCGGGKVETFWSVSSLGVEGAAPARTDRDFEFYLCPDCGSHHTVYGPEERVQKALDNMRRDGEIKA